MGKVKLQRKTQKNDRIKYIFTVFAFILVIVSILIDHYTANTMREISMVGTLSALVIVTCFIKLLPLAPYCTTMFFVLSSTYAGSLLEFYNGIPCYDLVIHFISGVLLVILADLLLTTLQKITFEHVEYKSKRTGRCIRYFFCAGLSIAGAGFWEIYEFMVDVVIPGAHTQGGLADSMTDMIAGLLGAGIGILILYIAFCLAKKQEKKKARNQEKKAKSITTSSVG